LIILGSIFVAGLFGPQVWDISLTSILGFGGIHLETSGNFSL